MFSDFQFAEDQKIQMVKKPTITQIQDILLLFKTFFRPGTAKIKFHTFPRIPDLHKNPDFIHLYEYFKLFHFKEVMCCSF